LVDYVIDKGLLVLDKQIDARAPNRATGSDGFKGDEAHEARVSDHNPETDPPPGNPDNQVDAGDWTHDPRSGADMGVISENIRLSRDRRVRYVIFNGRIFYGYDRPGLPAFTWTTYNGSDDHSGHMHVSVNDTHHDETQLWSIGMKPEDEKALTYRTRAMIKMLPINTYGDGGKAEDNELAKAINAIAVALNAMSEEVAKILPALAKLARDMEEMKMRMDSLEQGPEPLYFGTASITLQAHAPEVADAMLDEIARGGQ
jgi:hypothetical protein